MSIIYEPHDCTPARADAMSGHAYTPGLLWQCDTCARVYRFHAGEWDLAADPRSDYALAEARNRTAPASECRLGYRPDLTNWLEETMMANRKMAPALAAQPADAPHAASLPLEGFSKIVLDAVVAALPRLPHEQDTGLTTEELAAAVRAVDYITKQWKHQRSPGDAYAHSAVAASAAVLTVTLFQQLEREEQAK